MVIITHEYKPARKFAGVKYFLEDMGTKSVVDARRKQLINHGFKTRVLKGKKVGYVSQQYLLYAAE